MSGAVETTLEALESIDGHLELLARELGVEPPWDRPGVRDARARRDGFVSDLRQLRLALRDVDCVEGAAAQTPSGFSPYLRPPDRAFASAAPLTALAMYERWADGLLDLCARDLRRSQAALLEVATRHQVEAQGLRTALARMRW